MPPIQSSKNFLIQAAGAALQWRLLLLWTALLLLPTLILTLPFWSMLGEQFDHAVNGAELARRLDFLAVSDLMLAVKHAMPALSAAAVVAGLLALLLMPLQSGMLVTAARVRLAREGGQDRGQDRASAGFGALVTGGFALYGRMLRVLVWAVVPLGAALALGGAALHGAGVHNESAILGADAQRLTRAALALAVIVFLLADVTLDAARAMLAVDARRTSAVKAWWRGVLLLRRRPGGIAGWLCITIAGLLVAALLTVMRIRLAGGGAGAGGMIALFLLTQLAALALAWMRGARLFSLIALASQAVGVTRNPALPLDDALDVRARARA
jgi:hypothetical protein